MVAVRQRETVFVQTGAQNKKREQIGPRKKVGSEGGEEKGEEGGREEDIIQENV